MAQFATLGWLGLMCYGWKRFSIALGLMCLTPNHSLGVLSGIAPLAKRFVYPSLRYLVVVFYRLDHPLKRRLETLSELNLGRCIVGYSDVLPLNVVSSESVLLAAHFVGDNMESALSGVETSMYPVVAPRELLTATARYEVDDVYLYGWLFNRWMCRVYVSSD
jgi:hypothetical protein